MTGPLHVLIVSFAGDPDHSDAGASFGKTTRILGHP